MKLRDFKRFFNELLKYVSDGVHIIDNEGKTIYYNSQMEEIEHLKGKEVLSRNFEDIFSQVDDSTMLRSLKTKEIIKDKVQQYINKHGRKIVTINTTFPIIDGEDVIAVVEVAKDMTKIQEMNDTIINLMNVKRDEEELDFDDVSTFRYSYESIIGKSAKILECINLAKKASKNDVSVFIFGETGTGKELIAQSIHYGGIRKNKRFVAQNCSAIPEALLEATLFGTTKGAFVGALDKEGLFEQANGGTLLLDEINSMPLKTQAKLLRVLQERYVRRVGGTKDIPIDVRVIAISNEGIDELLKENKFRKDLFYRLNVINIDLPPLRERKEDIILLAEEFIKKYTKEMNTNFKVLGNDAKELLINYDYPGNVRELENIIARTISLNEDETILKKEMINIKVKSVYNDRFGKEVLDEIGLDEYLKNIEKDIIENQLRISNGNITRTADKLKTSRQNLQHKIKKYKIKL